MMQESKQLERQQHLEEQHRLHVSGSGLDQYDATNGSLTVTNGTDHVDDFLARIDKQGSKKSKGPRDKAGY